MVYPKTYLAKLVAIILVTTSITPVTDKLVSLNSVALAQSFGTNPESFPIPRALPEGTTLRVDGSTSMRMINEELRSRFEEQFPNAQVRLNASRTDEALQALLNGEIQLVASGRPLTEAEKAQGLVEVPLEREKLAIVLGPDNPFDGNLSFEQFAQIFRGEITNWSEVGGPNLPIRMIDRPDYSDTRRALSTYDVFEGTPFETGETADPVNEDETDAVVAELGNDGIGYAVVSQVIDRQDVRILPMHQTLPDDPRYPYSQYRAFVYREGAEPAVLAFLGFATTPPGQEVIVDSPAVGDGVAEAESPAAGADDPGFGNAGADGIGDGNADSSPGESGGTEAEAPDPAGEAATPADAQADSTAEADTALLPDADAAEGQGFPWWLLWLLGIPILGGLLWWLLKGSGSPSSATTSRPGGPPSASQTGTSAIAPDGSGTGVASPPVSPGVTTVAAAAGPVAAAAAATTAARIVLTPRNSQSAYAYWEIPEADLEAAKRQGGKVQQLRLYDVTELPPDAELPAPVAEFACEGEEPDLYLPINRSDRDYLAEVGYFTGEQRWLPLARSKPVHVPAVPAGAIAAGAAALGATALGTGALLSQSAPGTATATSGQNRIVLTPRNQESGYTYWEVSEQARASLKSEGGQDYQLRIYDVTDIDQSDHPPHSVAVYDVAETDSDRSVPFPAPNRDYMAEIGYRTNDGDWLTLARSRPVMPEAVLSQPASSSVGTLGAIAGGIMAAGGVAAVTAARSTESPPSPVVASPISHRCAIETVAVHGQHHAVALDTGQIHHLKTAVATTCQLQPGLHILRIRDGVFNYDGDEGHPGEPFVLLWICGGSVVNQKTGVPVKQTWSTLNGYADTLTLNVLEPTSLYAFFVDTYPEDNVGEVTLSVIRI
jgi:ABC-type phosphate transport system substrate-binding protein